MKLQELRGHLEQALHAAKMTNAHFGPEDEMIKARTQLYRDSWLIPYIEQSLELVNEEINKKKRK